MASLVLGVAGSAIGGAIAPGLSLFGGAITGATIGGAIGSFAGGLIDNALFSQHTTVRQEGPRLSDVQVQASSEGAPIPRVYGRARLAGQLIWATKFKETVTTTTETVGGGGKGFGGGGSSQTVETTTYSYSVSFAVGLCEGVINRIGRVWADGKLLNLADFTVRIYKGTEGQSADPLIQQIEGSSNAPAYRGTAYVVFDNMPLAKFGNRIPQMQFEVLRSLDAQDPDAASNAIRAVSVIPSAGEFVYGTTEVVANLGPGVADSQNQNNNMGVTNYETSIDTLEDLIPNIDAVSLVVSWFGDDLRADQCTIKPKVETATKSTSPYSWSVNGVARGSAGVVSYIDGLPALGGTPADQSIVEAIQLANTRGLSIMFYPFILMDIPASNTLPDPYSDNASTVGQPDYPWRGRITPSPAPGYAGSPDKTAAVSTQVNAFFGSAAVGDFNVSGTTVTWTGGADWGYRRMVLHYAHLCKAAGGVDTFIIGSELPALTTARSAAGTYPVVTLLKTLAADVSSILGAGTKVSYAADWTEYFGHQPADGSNDVYFHLDALWSDGNIDFVAIDNYMPLSDWRDGQSHLDYVDGRKIYDRDYLQANIEGGEGFDWYYASDTDRDNQTRTTITDGAYGKPWVFRNKDVRNWWLNQHYNRPAGVESGSPTSWVPQSKPIWFTEFGCPAINKGSNQPNVFYDPKSSESFIPHYSNGKRDDLIQRRYLEALLAYWKPSAGNNPTSSVYADDMITWDRAFVWTWDARPYPDFPSRKTVWSDGPNWHVGHWITGRIGLVPLADLVADVLDYFGFAAYDVSGLFGLVTGFLIDRTMSPRDIVNPLSLFYQFDGFESEGVIKFEHRSKGASATLVETDLALKDGQSDAGFQLIRGQETDLPIQSRLNYVDGTADYRSAVVASQRLVGTSDRVAVSTLPMVIEQYLAQGVSDSILQDAWVMRERGKFDLPPSLLALDPTDIVDLTAGGRAWRFRLESVADTDRRSCDAVRTDSVIYDFLAGPRRDFESRDLATIAAPVVAFMDLPLITGEETPYAPFFAATSNPWPGQTLVYRSSTQSGYVINSIATIPAVMARLNADFYAGPVARWDRGNDLYLEMYYGELSSKTELEVLNGANIAAVQNDDGEWEIVQFVSVELQAPGFYKCSQLLRGQAGTEGAMRNYVPQGNLVVILSASGPIQLDLKESETNLPYYWRYGPSGYAISDARYAEQQLTFTGIGRRPLSPVHINGERESNNDITITWVRRTRINGDSWDQIEVPLGEDVESYEVDIMNGSIVVRTLASSSETVTYTAAQQTADWGSYPSQPVVNVYQISNSFGRGQGRQATLWYV